MYYIRLGGAGFVRIKSIGCKCDDGNSGIKLTNLLRCFQSIHDRHLYIHQDKVEVAVSGFVYSVRAILYPGQLMFFENMLHQ